MPRRRKSLIAPRKSPAQARSRQLVADVLEAAIRVLKRHGAAGFTTIRVAQTAGISVGSLYQYFPNKESILFRLQADEWEATWGSVRARLFAPGQKPFARLEAAVTRFFETEAEEAELRVALDDSQELLRQAPEARALHLKALDDLSAFIAEAAPGLRPVHHQFATRFVFVTLGAVAEKVTEQRPSGNELTAWARATSAMLEHWLRAEVKRAKLE
ncbi:MAG: TetR/AcrR family transcriptional regulator [Myxococcaceae bacterium]